MSSPARGIRGRPKIRVARLPVPPLKAYAAGRMQPNWISGTWTDSSPGAAIAPVGTGTGIHRTVPAPLPRPSFELSPQQRICHVAGAFPCDGRKPAMWSALRQIVTPACRETSRALSQDAKRSIHPRSRPSATRSTSPAAWSAFAGTAVGRARVMNPLGCHPQQNLACAAALPEPGKHQAGDLLDTQLRSRPRPTSRCQV